MANQRVLSHDRESHLIQGKFAAAAVVAVDRRGSRFAGPRTDRRAHGQRRTDHRLRHRTALQARHPDARTRVPDREVVINELIDETDQDPGSQEVEHRSDRVGHRLPSMRSMAGRMRMNAEQLTKMLEGQGIRPETLKSKVRADTVWTNLVRGRYKESLLVNEKEVHSAVLVKGDESAQQGDQLRIHHAPDCPRGATRRARRRARDPSEGSRGAARADPELQRSQRYLPNHARRRDTRQRHQDFGRPGGAAARNSGQDRDRSPDPAGGHQAGHRDGSLCAIASRPPSTGPRSAKSATRCSCRNSRPSRTPICRKFARRR